MYNPQLETFLRVAEAGSFSKAAEEAFLTPTAVIKQMNLLLMHRKWSKYVDRLRDDLWQNHPQIHIINFDFYNMDIFNRCENSNDILLAIPGWANVHPLLKVIPLEWDHSIPFGLLHAKQPSERIQRFLEAVKETEQEI